MKYADLDARTYKKVIEAFNMPNSTKSEAAERDLKIEESIIPAIEIPLEVMRNAEAVVNLASLIVGKAIKAAVSDALVAAITAHAAIEGALVNIKSNILICRDRDFTSQAIKEGMTIATGVREEIKRILKIVDE